MPIGPKKMAEWKADTEVTVRAVEAILDEGFPSGETAASVAASVAVAARKLSTDVVPALLADREELLGMLRQVEWTTAPGTDVSFCPSCRARAMPGEARHAPDCRLAALLRGA